MRAHRRSSSAWRVRGEGRSAQARIGLVGFAMTAEFVTRDLQIGHAEARASVYAGAILAVASISSSAASSTSAETTTMVIAGKLRPKMRR